MATRRLAAEEKTHLDRSDPTSNIPTKSDTASAVPARVIIKLVLFSIAMFVIPISSYFVTLHRLYGGNTTYAGITAALLANVVLASYIIAAVQEDQGDQSEIAKQAAALTAKGKGKKVE